MLRLIVVLIASLLVTGASAQTPSYSWDKLYAPAEQSYQKLSEHQRFEIQWALVLSGFQRENVSYNFSRDVYFATREAQHEHDWPSDGRMTPALMGDLTLSTLLSAAEMRFEPFVHPSEKIEIWVPAGLDLVVTPTKQGQLWHNEARTFAIDYRFVPKTSLATQQEILRRVRDETGAEQVRNVVTKTYADATLKHRDGSATRSVYHRYKDGLIGFEIAWKVDENLSKATRAMFVALGSLEASLAKKPFSRYIEAIPKADAEGLLGLTEILSEIPISERQRFQILMVATDVQKTLPQDEITFDFLESNLRLGRVDNDAPLSEAHLHRLFKRAEPQLAQWGFQEHAHPTEGFPIWLPAGLVADGKRQQVGMQWSAKDRSLDIYYNYYPSQDFDAGFRHELVTADKNKDELTDFWKKRDSYLVRGRMKNGGHFAKIYHRHKSGIMGLSLLWNPNALPEMDQAFLIMQASLAAAMEKRAFPKPDTIAEWFPAPRQARTAPGDGAEPKPDDGNGGGSGTGFFVSEQGHILTNAHVVDGCGSILVATDEGDAAKAELVARDAANDLALLKTDYTDRPFVAFRAAARLGEGVAAFGFPLTGTLSSNGNFTLGNITALAGIGEDSRFNQLSAPVQPGNSGGPLLDMNGNVVGVVTAKLNALAAMKATGDIPQNVNFAIKPALAVNFLESHDLTPNTTTASKAMETADLADYARKIGTFVVCRP